MSIVLTIKIKNNPEINIPIATELFFDRCWVKVAKKNNLQLILSMQSGYTFDQLSIKPILEELIQMTKSISIEELETQDFNFLKERLVFIVNQISQVLAQEEGSFIGYVG